MRASSGLVSSSTPSSAGSPVFDALTSGPTSLNRPRRLGEIDFRSTRVGDSCRAAGRSWVTSGSALAANLLRRRRGGAGLAQERRQGDERRGELAVADGRGLEHAVGVLDQRAQLAAALGDRVEDHAGVADEAARRAVLAAQDPQHVVDVLGERRQAAERLVQPLAPGPDGAALLVEVVRERRPGLGVERAEDLVELDRRGDLGLRQATAVGQLRPRAVARGELDVGLAEQGLLAQDRPRVARQRGVVGVELERRRRSARSRRRAAWS